MKFTEHSHSEVDVVSDQVQKCCVLQDNANAMHDQVGEGMKCIFRGI